MKLAITGASGQLGSYLMDLSLGKHRITGIDKRESPFREHRNYIVNEDIRDLAVMKKRLKGCDAVLHCAAQVSVVNSINDPIDDLSNNVQGTIALLQAAADCKVKKFVYVSSAAVYGDPIKVPIDETHPLNPKSPYGASKMSAEQYCRVFAETRLLPYVVVRPFNFYSPRADPRSPYSGVITKFVEWAKHGRPLLVEGDGEQTRDFIHAQDVARMIISAAESKASNVTLNCGSGKGTTINQLARTVVMASGKDVEIVHIAPRVGDIRHSVSGMSNTKRALGFRTEVSLQQGIGAFFEGD
ncbi:MAG TPA: NAD-dependent epimerase/dehydratase family protein [Methanomassiliicoccales archaeon]|nr:NAD-dependent epimerase/dehydratase family protein [Methanomassiliicoccales archaeon]